MGVYAAMFGLGTMGTEESVAFLKSLADGNTWRGERQTKHPEKNYTPEKTESNFRQHAIACIGLAENEIALEALDRLEEEFDGSQGVLRQIGTARKWVEEHASPERKQ